MEVRTNSDTDVVEDQITYIYTFKEGRSTSSFGTLCAALNGIDPTIIDRADELILMSSRGEDLTAACAKLSANELVELEGAERAARQFLEQDFHALEEADLSRLDIRGMLQDVLAMARPVEG